MKTIKKIYVFILSIIYLPMTILTTLVACILLVDDWANNIIDGWLKEMRG